MLVVVEMLTMSVQFKVGTTKNPTITSIVTLVMLTKFVAITLRLAKFVVIHSV